MPHQEKVILEGVRVQAERFKPELFEFFRWPLAQILEESPLLVAEREPEEQFRTWLRLWPAHCTVWIRDIYSSGKPEHRTHFRPVADWYQIGPVMGNYTCGSPFKAGSYQRTNENLNGHRFLVVESDVLSRDEVGAVFAYLNRRLHFGLHAIVDTGGKSLHAWLMHRVIDWWRSDSRRSWSCSDATPRFALIRSRCGCLVRSATDVCNGWCG